MDGILSAVADRLFFEDADVGSVVLRSRHLIPVLVSGVAALIFGAVLVWTVLEGYAGGYGLKQRLFVVSGAAFFIAAGLCAAAAVSFRERKGTGFSFWDWLMKRPGGRVVSWFWLAPPLVMGVVGVLVSNSDGDALYSPSDTTVGVFAFFYPFFALAGAAVLSAQHLAQKERAGDESDFQDTLVALGLVFTVVLFTLGSGFLFGPVGGLASATWLFGVMMWFMRKKVA